MSPQTAQIAQIKERGVNRHLIGIVVAAALLATGLTGIAAAQEPNNQADVVMGSGSDTTYGVMSDLDLLYNSTPGCRTEKVGDETQKLDLSCQGEADVTTENVDHDIVGQYFPLGSSNGISQLCQQGLTGVAPIDYARSSRGPRDTDCDGLRFVAFARDAIPWVTFPGAGDSAGVTNLSQQQLRSIFATCEIKDWRQIKDPNFTLPANYDPNAAGSQPIEVYAAQRGSGTRATFDGFLGSGNVSDACIPAQFKDGAGDDDRVIFENNAQPIVEDGNQGNAIFYYSVGRHRTSGGEGTELGSIDGVEPTDNNIVDGSYPYSRFVYNVYRATAEPPSSDAAQAYVSESDGWICKPDAEHSLGFGELVTETIADNGFVPLPVGPIGGGVSGDSKCRVSLTAPGPGPGPSPGPSPGTSPSPGTTGTPTPTTSAEPTDADDTTTRLAGAGRVETAIELSQAGFDQADAAILARANDFPDALAAATLAAEIDGPVLLTNSDALDPGVSAELDRLGAETVYLAGGTAALSTAVEDGTRATGAATTRLAGADRFETAALIAQQVVDLGGAVDQVIVARSDDFPDALSASNLATNGRAPILLTATDNVPDVTMAKIGQLVPQGDVFVAGGTVAVSDAAFQEIQAGGQNVTRLSGANRFDTALALLTAARSQGADLEPSIIANGFRFPDALAAGPAANALGGALLLVDPDDLTRSPATQQVLTDEAETIDTVFVAGGTAAITQLVEDQVLAAVADA